MRPLDDWLESACRPAGFFAYERPAVDRPVATWFLAAVPDSRIVAIWHDAMLRFLTKARWCSFLKTLRLPYERPMSWAMPRYRGFSVPESDDPKDENYFWCHRLFQLCLDRNDRFRGLWSSAPKIAAAGPHILQKRGLLSPVDEDIQAHIEGRRSNLYKLIHRVSIPADISGTVLDALYRSGEA